MLSVVDVEWRAPVPPRPIASTEPPAGPAGSLANVRVVGAALPARSVAVTVAVGALAVPAVQLNGAEVNGPPAGVETLPGACDQPVAAPVSAAVALDRGP